MNHRITNILISILFLGILLIGCKKDEIQPTSNCNIPAWDNSSEHPDGSDFQEILEEYTTKGLPGISILIRNGNGVWAGSSGMADIAKNVPMLPCHVSKIASITKTYIGVLSMILVEETELNLDDPLTKWLDEKYTSKVKNADKATFRQVLNHSSGIADVIDDNKFYLSVLNDPSRFWEPEALLEFVYGDEPSFEVGTSTAYSNTNFLLATMVIEAASGRPHEDLLKEKVLNPLNADNTYYHWHDALPDFVAQGYFDLYNNGTILNISNYNTGSGNGYGGIYATVYEMQNFIESLLRDKTLLPQSSLDKMLDFEPLVEGKDRRLGLGIMKDFLERPENEFGIGHRGRDLGYTADCYYFPNQDATLVYLINYGTDAKSELRDVFFEFRDRVVDELMTD
ncbi:MAG: D-alanyl-D-alanine carboxypeptidase [Saprospiraceae bacterium]|jgi:D-alanyl-D-alanine carboxypeptidase